jgi:GNAT superfamily N-acetyltransferase
MNLAHSALSERPASADDGDFLFRLYASTRAEELAAFGWPPAQLESFLRMQFHARRQSYAAAFSDAVHSILLAGTTAAGSAIVWRGAQEIRLVDIALLPEFRNRGLGGQWISGLIREARAAGLPLRLSVLHGNPAGRLYERLGFVPKSAGPMYIEMEHHAGDPE